MKPAVLGLAVLLAGAAAYAEQADITLALGSFDLHQSDSAMAQLEYRPGFEWYGFRPQFGVFATSHSAGYVYVGAGYPLVISGRWTLLPSVSAGYYNDGGDVDLGHDVQFYSQLRLVYRVADDAAVGLGIAHISNAHLGDSNPGAETAYLGFGVAY